MTTILHISYDLRDRNGQETTSAVCNLIETTRSSFKSLVIDLMRVTRFSEEFITLAHPDHLTINSFGLPRGLFLLRNLKRAYTNITRANTFCDFNIKAADIIHAHKLTFEGYIGSILSHTFEIPLIVTLRQTDFYVLNYRPDLINRYKAIIKQSRILFYPVPNMILFLKKKFGQSFYSNHIANKAVFLPNIIPTLTGNYTGKPQNKQLLTITRMTKKSVQRKNIRNLFRAIRYLQDSNIRLSIVGDGDYYRKVIRLPEAQHIKEQTEFYGKIQNSQLHNYYAKSQAFVLPSYSETFGMCYAEALHCGTPILYSKNVLGFENIFNNVGIGVNPSSVESIAKGIRKIIANNEFYRSTIHQLKKSGKLNIFSANSISNKYKNCIDRLLKN